MKTLNLKGFKKVTADTFDKIFGWNSPLSNGDKAIAIDNTNKKVIIKCACWNCGDVNQASLTKSQIKKINTILNQK